MKLLSIGKYIYKTLVSSAKIADAVEGRIYPLVTEGSRYPFIVFSRDNIMPDISKNGPVDGAFINAEVTVVSDSYPEGVDIAEAVIEALDGVTAREDDYDIDLCRAESAREAFTNDAFVQIVDFKFHINDNNN